MPKTAKLTKKQRGFVKDYVLTENGTQAALKNYDTEDRKTAGVIAVENLAKPSVIEAIENTKKRFADRFSDEEIETVIREGFKSTSVRFTPEGEQIEVPDFNARHKYANTAVEIKGHKAPEKHVNLNIDVETTSEVRSAAEALNALYGGTGEPSDGTIPNTLGDKAQDQERSGAAD